MRFSHARALVIFAATLLLGACEDGSPLLPETEPAIEPQYTSHVPQHEIDLIVRNIRQATDRYHDINNAIADGFVFVHGCEVRPGHAPAGMVYAHPGRMGDGKIRPRVPDGLLYEPSSTGAPRLVGVELVMPYALWTQQDPPRFLGHDFEREDEFGVFGLHVWVWDDNPDGLFADGNPNLVCED